MWWCVTVNTATQEAEAGRLLDSRSSRSVWATQKVPISKRKKKEEKKKKERKKKRGREEGERKKIWFMLCTI
jgi:hypothetical protein